MSQKPLMAVAVLALAGCSSTPDPIGGAPGLVVVPGDLPAPTSMDIAPTGEAYGVGPFDQLKIDVFGVSELSGRSVVVDADGRISFPLVGSIAVGGLSAAEIGDVIATRLSGQYVRDPQVSVLVEKAADRVVTVYGQVQTPGVYPARGKISLMRAIASARGLSEYANARDVVVFRTVNGQRMATLYDIQAISRGVYDDPDIYPNDVVAVGDNNSRRLFDDIVGAATLIATPITVFLQQN